MDRINVLNKGYVRLVNHLGGDIDVVNAARVSFDKESALSAENDLTPKDAKLLQFLWKEGHTAPFRHAALTFEVYAPLMVARQHWKHTVASTYVDDQNGWNESSRRYVTETPEFYIPEAWRSTPENKKQGSGGPIDPSDNEKVTALFLEHLEQSERLYEMVQKMGVCTEQARLFLPAYGLYIRYRWTTSLHGVMNYINLRMDDHAQVEIQEYAKAIKDLSSVVFPHSIRLLEN